jgi:hypothetical protein
MARPIGMANLQSSPQNSFQIMKYLMQGSVWFCCWGMIAKGKSAPKSALMCGGPVRAEIGRHKRVRLVLAKARSRSWREANGAPEASRFRRLLTCPDQFEGLESVAAGAGC